MKNIKTIAVFSFLATALLAISSCSKGEAQIINDYKNYSAIETPVIYPDINDTQGCPVLRSSTSTKVLVVPIAFKGYENIASDKTRSDINKAFNGEASDTSWESVRSFYKKSSLGKQVLDFTISDWYPSNMTPSEFALHSGSNGDGGTWYIMNLITDWYKAANSTNMSEFDANKDGYIDALWFVYGCPHFTKENEIPGSFWAFQFFNGDNKGKGNVESPIGMNYAWASYDFIYREYGESGIDAHTYIHETGHLHGLLDYYDTSYETAPMGDIDMMCTNICDHNSFSKFSLGWVKPYVATGSCSLSLRDYSKYGDCLILAPDYNGTAFGEYIMLELFSPTGLAKESCEKKNVKGFQGYQKAGIRILHVNSTMYTTNEKGDNVVATDKFDPSKTTYVVAKNTKNPVISDPRFYPLITTLTSNGENKGLENDNPYDASVLFESGSSFSIESQKTAFPDGKLSLGKNFPYTVNIGALNNDWANLQVIYNA